MTRNEQIIELYKKGETFEEIGFRYGLTKERIYQITKAEGTRPESRIKEWFGCSPEELDALTKEYGMATRRKYSNHSCGAKRRGIPFEISFPEWMNVWISSGHWNERGRKGHQYVMARYGDTGPYTVDNVTIITFKQNASESNHLKGKKK
jgi:hypothetical protein